MRHFCPIAEPSGRVPNSGLSENCTLGVLDAGCSGCMLVAAAVYSEGLKIMKSKLSAALVAVQGFVCAVVSPAIADIINVTVTGTVASGIDYVGIFGGGDLAGDAFTVAYTFDTSCNGCARGLGPYFDRLADGIPSNTSPSPWAAAVLSIDGHSVTIPGTLHAEFYGRNGYGQSDTYQLVEGDSGQVYVETYAYNYVATIPSSSLTTPFRYTVDPTTDTFGGGFALGVGQGGPSVLGGFSNASGYLSPSIFTLTNASAVPAPVAGAGLPGLILAGGGLLGWWRRRQKTA
jgi:hypothetical protein